MANKLLNNKGTEHKYTKKSTKKYIFLAENSQNCRNKYYRLGLHEHSHNTVVRYPHLLWLLHYKAGIAVVTCSGCVHHWHGISNTMAVLKHIACTITFNTCVLLYVSAVLKHVVWTITLNTCVLLYVTAMLKHIVWTITLNACVL